jgi:ribose transport system substrate-binding protein
LKFSPEKAITCAEQSVTLNPDFVIHSNFQGGLSGDQSMEIFDAAGVPVAVIDVWHPNAIFFGADNYAAGTLGGKDAGKYAADTWGCDDVHILLGENPPEGEAADLRMVGFRDGVRVYCGIPDDKVHRINLDGTADQAITATTDWLTAHPDATYVLRGLLDLML